MATSPHIRSRLLEVFPEKQTDVLAHVVIEAHDDLLTQADFYKLTGAVADRARQFGGLSNALGGSFEHVACDLVPETLE